jgi:itaconate CoA-transferase
MDAIPALGEHTEAILSTLGYSAEAIAALKQEKAI